MAVFKKVEMEFSSSRTHNINTYANMAAEKPVYELDGEHLTPEDVRFERVSYV